MSNAAVVLYGRLLAKARLRQLQLLIAIADQGTVKQAAEQVGVSQPAATQAIADLERLLEVKLFHRQPRGMELSEAGRIVMPVARQALQALQTSMETLAAVHSGARGILRVGAIPAAIMSEPGSALVALGELNPGLEIQVVEGVPARLLAELASGALNAVLTRRPATLGERYRFESLLKDEAVFGAGVSHPLAGRESVSLDEVAQYPWARAPLGVNVREVSDRLFAGRPDAPPVHSISTASPTLIMALLADNRTITLGPATAANWYFRRGLASRLRVEMHLPLEDLGVVYPVETAERPGTAELLNLLRARNQSRAHEPRAG